MPIKLYAKYLLIDVLCFWLADFSSFSDFFLFFSTLFALLFSCARYVSHLTDVHCVFGMCLNSVMFWNDLNPWNRWPNVLILFVCVFIYMENGKSETKKYQTIQIECQSWMCGMHSIIFILFQKLSFAMCLFRGRGGEVWEGKKAWWILSWKKAFVPSESFGISRLWMRVNYSFKIIQFIMCNVQVFWHQATKKQMN